MLFLHCFVCDLCVEVLKHSIEFVPMVSCLGSDTVHTDPSLLLALMAPPSALLTSSCRSPVRGSLMLRCLLAYHPGRGDLRIMPGLQHSL